MQQVQVVVDKVEQEVSFSVSGKRGGMGASVPDDVYRGLLTLRVLCSRESSGSLFYLTEIPRICDRRVYYGILRLLYVILKVLRQEDSGCLRLDSGYLRPEVLQRYSGDVKICSVLSKFFLPTDLC